MAYIKNTEKKYNKPKLIYLRSIALSMLFALIILLILAIVITYTSVSETMIPIVTSVVTVLAIALGGIFTAVNKKKNGLVQGIITGAIYVIIIMFLSWVFIDDFTINKFVFLKGLIGIVAGGVGGTIGVNLK